MLLVTQALLPAASLTGAIFGLAGAHLAFLLLTGIFLYAFHRDRKNVYVTYAFFAFAISLVLLFTRDQIAVRNATQDHAASLSIAAERELVSLRSAIGMGAKPLSGQEIFDAKCSACHMFDQKKVGPPYNTVIPKYAGKKEDLVKFILNPRKIDPAFPNMPGQGLKPAEGDSIAAYLLARVAPGKGG
jgi:cytochrome c551/c552